MVSPSVGSVVLVRLPFSDLSSSKLRPAVVLAGVDVLSLTRPEDGDTPVFLRVFAR